MNFHNLREILNIFKKKLRCNKCNKSFSNRTIFVQNIKKDSIRFKCHCKQCNNVIIADVNLVKPSQLLKQQRVHQSLQLKSKPIPKITQNDILDVKNFLKDFKGDFKTVFKQK